MQPLQEWFNRKLEILKSKNLHIKDEYVIPLYSFYLKMKNEYSEYHLDNWDEKYKEFYEVNFKK
jgi:ABC-type lipoprotein release transport system permease subunit